MPVLVIVHAPYVTIEPHSAVGERDTERGKDEHVVRVLNSQTESCALFQRLTIQCMLSYSRSDICFVPHPEPRVLTGSN
jgi:hypothetical protein